MSKPPTAAPHTEGRTFDTAWSIANVARLLRANASRGVWREETGKGGSRGYVNQYYLRTVSAFHLPSSASLIFMRLEKENCWYTSVCFVKGDALLPWNPETAELWLWALFGEDRPRVRETPEGPGARQFTLAMEEYK